jgi:hypothetical protein
MNESMIIGTDRTTGVDKTRVMVIGKDGSILAIYNEAEILGLIQESAQKMIKRASHVEPTEDGQWMADMGPVDGPVLGPYDTRQEALDHEVDWLTGAMMKGSLNVHHIE